MRESDKPILKCAIYTRKSSEEGLEQDFNSLHAQGEACEAYIKSQKHEGWVAVRTAYDDGGYSGGSMERPALRQLLDDIRAKHVDVVVVYKVDRLTRSLADFAKIVEVFDAAGVSFVSVTQSFNTTSSMGRLTLNVLLSFAQFEREVTGERIRDKIAASKKKGLWMGGFVPFGYRPHERTLLIAEPEAEIVRTIFQLYLELGSVNELAAELKRRELRTRAFTSAGNKAWGDRPFSRGHLYKILGNPIYAGKIAHKGQVYDGLHEAIIDKTTWDLVQAQLASSTRKNGSHAQAKQPSLLAGLLVDDHGSAFTCSHAVKDGKRYRYYVGGRREERGQTKPLRLPAHDIEAAVLDELKRFLTDEQAVAEALSSLSLDAHELSLALVSAKELATSLERAVERRDTLLKLLQRVTVTEAALVTGLKLAAVVPGVAPETTHRLNVPVGFRRLAGETTIILPGASSQQGDADPALVKAIARGFSWFEELAAGRADTVTTIAKREGVTDRYVSHLVDLAFLSPDLVEASLDGDRAVGISTKRLVLDTELDPLWRLQEQQVCS